MQDNQSWNKCKATVRVVLFTKKSFCQRKKKKSKPVLSTCINLCTSTAELVYTAQTTVASTSQSASCGRHTAMPEWKKLCDTSATLVKSHLSFTLPAEWRLCLRFFHSLRVHMYRRVLRHIHLLCVHACCHNISVYGQAAVTYRFPSDHRSQAPSSGVSTGMGDHPGTPRAVGNTWCTRHMAKPRPQVGRVC